MPGNWEARQAHKPEQGDRSSSESIRNPRKLSGDSDYQSTKKNPKKQQRQKEKKKPNTEKNKPQSFQTGLRLANTNIWKMLTICYPIIYQQTWETEPGGKWGWISWDIIICQVKYDWNSDEYLCRLLTSSFLVFSHQSQCEGLCLFFFWAILRIIPAVKYLFLSFCSRPVTPDLLPELTGNLYLDMC